MALREELSKLDSEVAAGQITADEFRVQRDRLLAAAGKGAAASEPFPPPYRWGESAEAPDEQTRAVPRAAPAEDRTQVVRRPSSSPSERTQVVRRRPASARAEDRTQVVRRRTKATPPPSAQRDADRTQVVRPGSVPRGYSTLGAPPWARGPAPPARESAPLRPEGTLPPWTLDQQIPSGQPPVQYGGATAFRAQRPHRWLLPTAAVIVVLIVLGVILFLVL